MKYLGCILLVVLFITGCEEKPADLKNVKNYEANGVSFRYPGNWSVAEDKEDNGYRFIYIESAVSAITILTICPEGSDVALTDYVEAMIESRIEETPFGMGERGEILEIELAVDGNVIGGIRNQYPADLLGVELPHTMDIYEIQTLTTLAFVACQVADEDRGKVASGFDLILESLELR